MSGERSRSPRVRWSGLWFPGRRPREVALPVRRTDRVEDLTAWLLVSLGLLAVLGAALVGRAAHDAARNPAGIGGATPIRVVLLADTPPPPTVGQRIPAPLPRVPVAWLAGDGTEHTGEMALRDRLPAGTAVTAWMDEGGRITAAPPQRASEAVAFGVGAALTAAASAWALLALLWAGVCRITAARNDTAWAREWARVEPMWSRRVR